MQFTVLPAGTVPTRRGPEAAFLTQTLWEDHGYRTTFLLLHRKGGNITGIGQVKIGRFGMQEGDGPSLPEQFDRLDATYFSVGQDDTYYEALRELGVASTILGALCDIAFDSALFQQVQNEDVTQRSLLRSIQPSTVTRQFRRIARGGLRVIEYAFSYTAPPVDPLAVPLQLDFKVFPEVSPPTNVHALIGSNGVGKTRLLQNLARAVADGSAQPHEVGEVTNSLASLANEPLFTNLVSIAFSAFDPLNPVRATKGIHHAHVTLYQMPVADSMLPGRSLTDPAYQFAQVMQTLTGARLERWHKAVSTLGSDPLFRDAQVAAAAPMVPGIPEVRSTDPLALFNRLSSGHKIVLLAITRLADLVSERTLVLIDEPETHLHPPLLAAFMRALTDLLVDRNGVAIIATHSPVVLQETPRRCVWKLYRSGDMVKAERPAIETYGENVGILTHESFGLEITRTGFHQEVRQAVDDGMSYEEIIDWLEGQLGGEGRSLARALIALRDQREGGR
ncbi:AAA family ATPase [Streptomyces sp. NPDC002643]